MLPEGFPYTRPYWHRDNPEEDAINTVDDPQYATLPFPPAPFHVEASYACVGKQSARRRFRLQCSHPFWTTRARSKKGSAN